MGGDLWSLPVRAAGRKVGELCGFTVEGRDGPVGTVTRGDSDRGHSYLIVSLDPALGRAKAMLPAGIVERVDTAAAVVRVACSRAQLAAAPRFESDRIRDAAYRTELTLHYAARPAQA